MRSQHHCNLSDLISGPNRQVQSLWKPGPVHGTYAAPKDCTCERRKSFNEFHGAHFLDPKQHIWNTYELESFASYQQHQQLFA